MSSDTVSIMLELVQVWKDRDATLEFHMRHDSLDLSVRPAELQVVVACLLHSNNVFTNLPLTPCDYDFSVQTGPLNFLGRIIKPSRERTNRDCNKHQLVIQTGITLRIS